MARMEISDPDVLRATRAHCAFRGCAQALRPEHGGNLYHESFVSEKISCFWSHSWHGGPWTKILTLLLHHNGLAAVLSGFFAALVAMLLFGLGLLRGIPRNSDAPDMQWSTWSLGSGLLIAVLVVVFWRSQQLIFLDRICIDRDDREQKRASIFSLGGILKKSKEMLVLWDSTWSGRLWCVFELAAFLKSQQSSSEKVLLIRPTFLGPCSMVLFFGSFFMMLPVTTMSFNQSWGPFGLIVRALGALLFVFIAGTFISLALRAYFRSVERLLEELRNISVENCRCACCDLDHTMDGANLLCDREIVKECVSIWFGSLEAFEESIRSELSDAMATGLKDRVFTRGWSLSVTTPILWAYFDVAVSWAAAGDVLWFFLILLDGWVLWFLCGPIYADYLTFIMCRYCRRARSTCGEILKNTGIVLLGSGGFLVIAGSYVLCQGFIPFEKEWYGAAVFGGSWLTVATIHLLYKVSRNKSHSARRYRLGIRS